VKTLTAESRSKPIPVPREIATCPICDADIVVEDVNEWESDSGKPIGISLECTTEPDIDSDEWKDWHRDHWSMPYVYWLPVENRVMRWAQKNFRCV